MAENETFKRLASEMSLEERRELLDRFSKQSSIPFEPLYEEHIESPALDIESQYAHLSWYERLWFTIISFFQGSSPIKIFEKKMVERLGRTIETQMPGIYEQQRNYLLPKFHAILSELKESARFFYTALDTSVQRDKGAFYAFLGSLVMGDIHTQLQKEITPVNLVRNFPEATGQELRQKAAHTMEEIFNSITQEQRETMYAHARSLYALKELSSFLYDRVLLAFTFEPSVAGQVCSANIVREQLIALNNILFSLKKSPEMTVLESMFVFTIQDYAKEEDFDLDHEIQELLAHAKASLLTIREFNKNVPLTLILRCVTKDILLLPQAIGGGEDWFVLYREYWTEHTDEQFIDYIRTRQQQELLASFRYFLKTDKLRDLEYAGTSINSTKIYISKAFALSFLLTFYSSVFLPDINKVLRPILIDGEFFKREHRTQFTESYNDLMRLEDDIVQFDTSLSPEGDYGKRFALANSDVVSLPGKRRKILVITEETDKAVQKIIETTQTAIKNMLAILTALVHKDSGGQYEILANMSKFTGKDELNINVTEQNTAYKSNKAALFMRNIIDVIQKFQKTLQILEEIENIKE
ncbi:MAG: DUF5312 domain-containing protein [Spirochaetaceae bacterium]|jgi:hypothetical protein|nr:DUF5312 domain-containing protein [Spirochaetaceae bacterium]